MLRFAIGLLLAPSLVLAEVSSTRDRVPLGHKDFYPSPEHPVGWRGDGSGRCPGANPVTGWDDKSGKNILWKLKLPFGLGQPVVVGNKVFTQGDPNTVFAVDALTGKVLWQVDDETVTPEEKKTDYRGWLRYYGRTFPTPVSDGEHVWFLSQKTMACYSLDGTLRWLHPVRRGGKQTGPDITQSPILVDGRLIVLLTAKRATDTVVAFDAATGKEAWRTAVTPDRGNEATGCAVPRVITLGEVRVVVTKMGDAVAAADGRLLGSDLFKQEGFTPTGYDMSTPVNSDGLALLRLDGKDHRSTASIQLRFEDQTRTRIVADTVWKPRVMDGKDGNGPKIGTQIQHLLFHKGTWHLQGWPDLVSIDGSNGDTLAWQQAPGEMRGHTVWHEYPMPHVAGRHIFTGDRNGYAAVYEIDPPWKRVALNRLDPEWHSSPFFQGDRIYIRTTRALYCVGPKPQN